MNSLLFSSSFLVNSEPIDQNKNGIFAKNTVKYDVDQEIVM
jgi:hypothetical protein